MAGKGTDAGFSPREDPVKGSSTGRRLGGFEILERIGQGGMGAVFKARQVSMDRFVALKILPRRLAQNKDFVQRFLREARSAAKLRHPNIVQAHDVGFADGYYFFAMEFVDGQTLSQIVARHGPLGQNRALEVMKQTCSALAAAHDAGIVHRDIKPANIMIDRNGGVRVTDFGLAKRTEGDVNVTADGRVLGTPAYVAPEMAKGAEADARSDLYSLGATVFFALSGRSPFEGSNFSEVLIKQATEPAPPLATVAPHVDRRLCYIIDRLLSKDPEARYPSAQALLDDLDGLGQLQPAVGASPEAPTLEMARRSSTRRRPRVRFRRQRTGNGPLIALAAVALVALVVVGIAIRRKPGPPSTRQVVRQHKPTTQQPPRSTTRPAVTQEKRTVEVARDPAREKAQALLRQAEAALAAGDFAKARQAVRAAQALNVGALAPALNAKLDEIASREKSAAARAKWEEAKAAARKLTAAGKLDEAAKLLAEARSLPLDGIGDLIAEEMATVEAAKRKAAEAAYKAGSDKVWALFKERKYAEADAQLKQMAAVVGAASLPRDLLEADLEAAKLLKEFWAAVERGLVARKSTISVAGAVGKVVAVGYGIITIQTPTGPTTRKVQQLDTKVALHYATFGKNNDERAHLAEAIFRIAEAHNLDPADLERVQELLATVGKVPGLSFYKNRLDPGKAAAEAKGATSRQVRRVDLLAEYEAGRWSRLASRGKWVKEPGGYHLQGELGGGPDFSWAYLLPKGTTSLRLAMKFRLPHRSGAVQITFDEKPGILGGTGVLLAYKWRPRFSVGRLAVRGADVRTAVLPDMSQGWHELFIDVEPGSIEATLDLKTNVRWKGQFSPTCIALSGDEFVEWHIESLRLDMVAKTEPTAAERNIEAPERENVSRRKSVRLGGFLVEDMTIGGPNVLVNVPETVVIAAEVALKIKAGTLLRFAAGTGLELRSGTLTAEGTKEAPILFTASDTRVGWEGVKIVGRGTAEMSWCAVTLAKMGLSANGVVRVRNCVFARNKIGIRTDGRGTYENCAIVACADDGFVGNEGSLGPDRLTRVTIARCGGIGYHGTHKGFPVMDLCVITENGRGGFMGDNMFNRGAPRITNSNIYRNHVFDVFLKRGDGFTLTNVFVGKDSSARLAKDPGALVPGITDARKTHRPDAGIVLCRNVPTEPVPNAGASAEVIDLAIRLAGAKYRSLVQRP